MNLPKTKDEFLNRYYLKKELIEICKEKNLPKTGSKENLTENICNFIENKPIIKIKNKYKDKTSKDNNKNSNNKNSNKNNSEFTPTLEKIIDTNYSNNELHRRFFKNEIGEYFKYNVPFMNWMKENKGKKTYKESIEMWNKIFFDKKSGKKHKIGKQFKYNQYTRDFFKNNPKLSREDCIKCWKYKKEQAGKHIYEKEDLKILLK